MDNIKTVRYKIMGDALSPMMNSAPITLDEKVEQLLVTKLAQAAAKGKMQIDTKPIEDEIAAIFIKAGEGEQISKEATRRIITETDKVVSQLTGISFP